jgi:hypothetical protein
MHDGIVPRAAAAALNFSRACMLLGKALAAAGLHFISNLPLAVWALLTCALVVADTWWSDRVSPSLTLAYVAHTLVQQTGGISTIVAPISWL